MNLKSGNGQIIYLDTDVPVDIVLDDERRVDFALEYVLEQVDMRKPGSSASRLGLRDAFGAEASKGIHHLRKPGRLRWHGDLQAAQFRGRLQTLDTP